MSASVRVRVVPDRTGNGARESTHRGYLEVERKEMVVVRGEGDSVNQRERSPRGQLKFRWQACLTRWRRGRRRPPFLASVMSSTD